MKVKGHDGKHSDDVQAGIILDTMKEFIVKGKFPKNLELKRIKATIDFLENKLEKMKEIVVEAEAQKNKLDKKNNSLKAKISANKKNIISSL